MCVNVGLLLSGSCDHLADKGVQKATVKTGIRARENLLVI